MMKTPSVRTTAALAAVMLVIGGVLGAAVGPGPSNSFAGVPIQRLLPMIAALAGAHGSAASPGAAHSSAASPPISAEPALAAETSTRRRHRRRHHASAGATSATSAQTETASPTSTTPTRPTAPTTGAGNTKATHLPPVSKVWLIELSGSSFAQATGQTAAPYIDTQAVRDGTLLSGWSALDAGTFAGDAALIAGSSPQLLDTIVQPPCPEASMGAGTSTGSGSGSSTNTGSTGTSAGSGTGTGSTGTSTGSTGTSTGCTAGTPGAVTAADEFLEATLPAITSTSSYRENGLIVITFASIATATASGLPAGAATGTLTSQPPAGALLISRFVAKGAKSQATFDPASPRQSLEQLLRR